MCSEGWRRLRGASLRIATVLAALSFVLPLSMRLGRSPICRRRRICQRRRAMSGCGLRLAFVLRCVRRSACRIARCGQRDLGPLAQPVGAVDDNLFARLEPIEHRYVLTVTRTEIHLPNRSDLVGSAQPPTAGRYSSDSVA